MPTRKISFMVPPGLWQSFKEQTDGLCINRAPFLSQMIETELSCLREDMDGRVLSTPAKRYIAGMLKRQGAKSVNVEIKDRTAIALNQVVKDHNLVRDAFLCRLIIFLRGRDVLLEWLEIPKSINGLWAGATLDSMSVSPMQAIEQVYADPLYYIRHSVKEAHGCGLYNVDLPSEIDWAACYIDEGDLPSKESNYRFPALGSAFEASEKKALSKRHGRRRS